ncbi:MAG: hypothetical protein II453_19485 [Alphaproteobacteria bacterium]|nr:hypothetical protein [Alphaproteobacteria bacterium]
MFRQAENKVKIEGILAETDLKYGSYEKNGEAVESIGGSIKVLVDQVVNGEEISLEIPIYMFSSKHTRAGKINPSYESIEKVMKEFVSIAAAGSKAQADKVRITNADIRVNEFVGQNGQIVSQPRIHASFVSRAVGDFHPEATFSLEFMVASINRVTDAEGVEVDPPRAEVKVYVPQYTPESASAMNVDTLALQAIAPGVLDAIENYWNPGECFKASGRLNFSSKTEEVLEEVDFGEPQRKVRTTNVSEFVVTGGSQVPLDGDFAWDVEDIKKGVIAKRERVMAAKDTKAAQKKTPAPAEKSSKNGLDLGF